MRYKLYLIQALRNLPIINTRKKVNLGVKRQEAGATAVFSCNK